MVYRYSRAIQIQFSLQEQITNSGIMSLSTRVEVNHSEDVNTSTVAPETTSPAQVQPLKHAAYNLPKLLYTNPRSIVSKIDELDEIIKLKSECQ